MRLSDLSRRSKNTTHATVIEYALIASLIAIALVTILTYLGQSLSAEFKEAPPISVPK